MNLERLAGGIVIAATLACAFGSASAAPLMEPQVFASTNGVLDILMVARPEHVPTLTPFNPTGWVYDICRRPADGSLSCPAVLPQANLYGGTHLQLQKGDHLKIRLVNDLPPVTDSEHAPEPGHAYLALNPTNVHTHGLLVSPQFPTVDNPTYGDNVYVMTLNPANGPLPGDSMIHSDVRVGYTDYDIAIPKDHPSGLFWFHPHVHGVALNQVASGMAGVITIGDIRDYVCKDATCAGYLDRLSVRHILLKDSQILKDGTLQDQLDPGFCNPAPAGGKPDWRGSCPGVNIPGEANYGGGRWFFTMNGQPYPTVKMGTAFGEIWRITNASASAGYNLQLWNPKQGRNMLFQVLAIDGIAVDPAMQMSASQITAASGAKIKAEPCPSSVAPGGKTTTQPICARSVLMMPSSRVELWVVDRDANDNVINPVPGDQAVFRTAGVQTGPAGDSWPAIDLGLVQFGGSGNTAKGPQTLAVKGEATSLANPLRLAANFNIANAKVGASANCKPLAPGHQRRIFFNTPTTEPDAFGLGYEELDDKGNPVPGTFQDVKPFDPATPTICVPLGKGNVPVHENWQLINLAGEDHNFHIHQTKFALTSPDPIQGGTVPSKGILIDNVPLPHADGGTCNSVADWRAGVCKAHPITVDIPFAIAGDFVYHCHILEHEDGGMMARIRVRASP